MGTFKLKDCKICSSSESDEGVQLGADIHIYGTGNDEWYPRGYTVFCCSCGLSVQDEYKDEVISIWNKLNG